MFLTSILKSELRGRKRPTCQRHAMFECLEDRRFCAATAGLALTAAVPTAPAAAVHSPANAIAAAQQMVQLNPQPEPPSPVILRL
jgi:hypothetical protein